MIDFGNRIKALRQRNKLKGLDLAKQVGISQPYLSDIEIGKKIPTIDLLEKICIPLNCQLHIILDPDDFKWINNDIGLKIKIARIRAGLSLNSLAKKAEVPIRYLTNIENNLKAKYPEIDFIMKVAKVLNIQPKDFLWNSYLGHIIKYYRQEKGLSIESLSKSITISKSLLIDIECGRHKPTFKILENLSNALAIEVYELARTDTVRVLIYPGEPEAELPYQNIENQLPE